MNFIIEHLTNNMYIYLGSLLVLIIIVVLLIVLKPKKVKPIEVTVDDEKKTEEKTEIEKVIEALESSNNERTMTSFEEEQEANAIISYQELVKAVNEKKLQANKELQVEKEEKIEDKIETPSLVLENLDIEEEEIKETPKFKNSEFISPVFGKDSNNNDFLKELKDFRKNL